jgi:amino acid transporter
MPKLARKLSLLAVIAGGLCSVIGGGINVLIVDIQNEVPGIGNLVPLSILLGGVVAFFVALTYAILASAMPRAGGGYIYVSRGLSPLLGFVLAFVKWCSSVIAIGIVAFMDTMILADSMHFLHLTAAENFLRSPLGSIMLPISLIWAFWFIHMRGVKKYGTTVIILMILMIFGGIIIIGTNLMHTQQDFIAITHAKLPSIQQGSWEKVLYATAILFWAYIGFTGVSQAGGEIVNPKKNLPLAFILTSILITGYYFLYSFAFYHAVPWQYIVGKSNLTVPGLTGLFLPTSLAFIISILVALALANDIPPMLLTTSRLFYSWGQDNIIPKKFAETSKHKVPHFCLTLVAIISSLIVIECALEGFFLAVNVVTISRFLVYILIALAVIVIEERNKKLYKQITFLKSNRKLHFVIACITIAIITFFLAVLIYRDLTTPMHWYEHITIQLIFFVVVAYLIYAAFVIRMKKKGIDYKKILRELPEE